VLSFFVLDLLCIVPFALLIYIYRTPNSALSTPFCPLRVLCLLDQLSRGQGRGGGGGGGGCVFMWHIPLVNPLRFINDMKLPIKKIKEEKRVELGTVTHFSQG
jgi:hypothetical protein